MMAMIVEQVVKEGRKHPFTMLVVLGLIGFAAFSLATHAYASEVSEVKSQLSEQAKIQECRWLSDKIERLENKLYTLERDGADPERIHENDQILRKFQDRYDKTTCSVTGY